MTNCDSVIDSTVCKDIAMPGVSRETVRLEDPSSLVSLMAEALTSAKVEDVERQGLKALPLKALCCSIEHHGVSQTPFQMVKLRTNYDFSKVTCVQVDAENVQDVLEATELHLVPIILHTTRDSLKLVFTYVFRAHVGLTNWCLSNSRGESVTFISNHSSKDASCGPLQHSISAFQGRADLICGLQDRLNELTDLGGGVEQSVMGSKVAHGGDDAKQADELRQYREENARLQQHIIEVLRMQEASAQVVQNPSESTESDQKLDQNIAGAQGSDKAARSTVKTRKRAQRAKRVRAAATLQHDCETTDVEHADDSSVLHLHGHTSSADAADDVEHLIPQGSSKLSMSPRSGITASMTADVAEIGDLYTKAAPVDSSPSLRFGSSSPIDGQRMQIHDLSNMFGATLSEQVLETAELPCHQERSSEQSCGFDANIRLETPFDSADQFTWPRTWSPWNSHAVVSLYDGAQCSSELNARHLDTRPIRDNDTTPTPLPSAAIPDNDATPAPLLPFAVEGFVAGSVSEQPRLTPQLRPDGLTIRSLSEETSAAFGDEGLRFVIHNLLGQGGFGSVYRCSLTHSDGPLVVGDEFAVKVIDAQRIALLAGGTVEMVVPRLLREVEVLHMLGAHPHIVTMHAAFYSKKSYKLYLLYELLRGGDLFNAIVRRRRPFGESDAHLLFIQLADAVLFGHKRGVAHRDLKMDNCLIEASGSLSVKLCDYGQAKIIGFNKTAMTLTSSARYTAPDVQLAVNSAKPYDAFKADAFALGVLLYGLLCNALPNAAERQYHQHPMWQQLSESAQDLLRKLLVADANERLSVEDLLQHPWVMRTPVSADSGRETDRTAFSRQISADVKPGGMQLNVLLAVHRIVVTLQRERGSCLWDAAGTQFQWNLKHTDDRCAEAMQLLDDMADVPLQNTSALLKLRDSISVACARTSMLRTHATKLLVSSDPSSSGRHSVVDQVARHYSSIISVIMQAIASSLLEVCGTSGSFGVKAIRHKLLMFTAEQLGRERALLCGYLHHAASLRDPQVASRIHQVIGARKLLLGSSADLCEIAAEPNALCAVDGESCMIVAGEVGLLPALNLMDAPLLDAAELAHLENAEDRALAIASGEAPQLSEWYFLLTKLIDKIHQHVTINIVDHFPMSSH